MDNPSAGKPAPTKGRRRRQSRAHGRCLPRALEGPGGPRSRRMPV